jgi:hypothetical protein
VGNPLTCSNGTWTNSPTAFAHQWLRNGQPIPGATAAAYVGGRGRRRPAGRLPRDRIQRGGNSQPRTSNAVVPSAATPVLTVTVPKQSLQSVISKGLTFNASCLVSAQVTGPVPPKRKKRGSRGGRAARTAVVGRVTASVVGGTTQKLTAKISRAGRAALSKRSKASLRLAVTATDPSGSPSTTKTTSVSLKRTSTKKGRRRGSR